MRPKSSCLQFHGIRTIVWLDFWSLAASSPTRCASPPIQIINLSWQCSSASSVLLVKSLKTKTCQRESRSGSSLASSLCPVATSSLLQRAWQNPATCPVSSYCALLLPLQRDWTSLWRQQRRRARIMSLSFACFSSTKSMHASNSCVKRGASQRRPLWPARMPHRKYLRWWLCGRLTSPR